MADRATVRASNEFHTQTLKAPNRGPIERALLPAGIAIATLLWLRILPPQPFVAYSFVGVPLLFWARRPYPREWIAVGGVAVPIASWYCANQASINGDTLLAGVALGLGGAAIIVAAFAAARGTGAGRRSALRDVAALSAMPCMLFAGFTSLTLLSSVTPQTFDSLLTAADRSFGFHPSFLAGQALRWTPATWALGMFTYDVLPALLLATCALRRRRLQSSDDANLLLALFVAGGIATLCYLVLPASGPIYQWHRRFPSLPPELSQLSLVAERRHDEYFRNALPSIHMAAALLVFWGTAGLGKGWRIAAGVNLVLTVLVTLGTGQHYAVDLVAAVPTAVAATALADRTFGWRRRCVTGLLCLSFWIVLLRFAAPWLIETPGLTWITAAAVVGTPLFAAHVTSARRRLSGSWLRDSAEPVPAEPG